MKKQQLIEFIKAFGDAKASGNPTLVQLSAQALDAFLTLLPDDLPVKPDEAPPPAPVQAPVAAEAAQREKPSGRHMPGKGLARASALLAVCALLSSCAVFQRKTPMVKTTTSHPTRAGFGASQNDGTTTVTEAPFESELDKGFGNAAENLFSSAQ